MPGATVPHDDNVMVDVFSISVNGQSLGRIQVGSITGEKRIIDIIDGNTNNPVGRKMFYKPLVITGETVDLHWLVIAELSGLSPEDISAGTSAIPTDIGFTVYDDKVSKICGNNYINGVENVVLNSAANGGGTSYTEGTDYVVQDDEGTVSLIEGGAINDGDTVYVESGNYVTVDSKRIKLKKDELDAEISAVSVTKDFTDGKTLTIYMYKGHFTNNLEFAFELSDEPMQIPFEITSIQDDTHAGEEFGYIDWEE
ncbi:MAG: hypothetical protein ABEK36_03975 [Candidatus Aenigmatarchaeota archaeon]